MIIACRVVVFHKLYARVLLQPEGIPKEYSNYVLVDLKNSTTFSSTVPLSLPNGVVSGSQRAVFTAIGNYRVFYTLVTYLAPT